MTGQLIHTKNTFQFLNAMAKKDLIQVKEFPKGIENITAINWAHEDIKAFVVDLVSVAAQHPCEALASLDFIN